MAQASSTPVSPVPVAPTPSRHRRMRLAAGLTASLGLVLLGGLVVSNRTTHESSDRTPVSVAPSVEQRSDGDTAQNTAAVEALPADPLQQAEAPVSEPEHVGPEHWRSAISEAPAAVEAPETNAQMSAVESVVTPETPSPVAQALTVPLPMPRPADLSAAAPRRAARQTNRRVSAVSPVPAPTEDTRSFFDRLFGVEQASTPATPALAYASLESTGSVGARPALPRAVPLPVAPSPAPQAGGGTAVYDISARTVTLPSGEKLEAHSGLGSAMDDPRFVHLRMRGPTPPGTYDLSEREVAFHGVRAIRMTPVGGSAAIHGRDGILAHTYMLGASGASNGCVAFRDYDKFLQAHLRGDVVRLVVVSGAPQDALPSLVKRIFGTDRTTKVGSAE